VIRPSVLSPASAPAAALTVALALAVALAALLGWAPAIGGRCRAT